MSELLPAYRIEIKPLPGGKLMAVSFGKPSDGDEIVRTASRMLESVDLSGGGVLLINGPMTLPVAFVIAHKVIHMFTTVAVFDPKLDSYLVVANHGGMYNVGDFVQSDDIKI